MSKHEISIKAIGGATYMFSAVPMMRMPSENNQDWLRFQREHVPCGQLADVECDKLQSFMKRMKTEAVTDGAYNYTVAGGDLAFCKPEAII
jgi:hypothetical protein